MLSTPQYARIVFGIRWNSPPSTWPNDWDFNFGWTILSFSFPAPDAHSATWPPFPEPLQNAVPGRLKPHFLSFSTFPHCALSPSGKKKKQNAPLRGVTGNFLSGAADNYKEHRRENNRNLVASNGAGSQTVRKPFLQVSHPILISIYNAAERRRLARLNCLW